MAVPLVRTDWAPAPMTVEFWSGSQFGLKGV